MEVLIYSYLTVGFLIGLVIWWASFSEDFDDYARREFKEEPPTTKEKWMTILAAPLFWPYFLWKAFK